MTWRNINGVDVAAGSEEDDVMFIGKDAEEIYAVWGLGGIGPHATGEVLARAVELACLANPERMLEFACGDEL